MKRFVLLLALLPATTWAQYHVAVTDATSIKIPVQAIASSDHLTEKTDVSTLTCKKSLNGGTTGDCAGTSAEVSDTDQPGTWAYTLHADDVSAAGVLVMRFSATGMDPYRATVQIGNLPANMLAINSGATSGNNAELKLKSLNITNSAGTAVTYASTGSNGVGFVISGNGTGYGMTVTGGSPASGDGGKALALTGGNAGTSGDGGDGFFALGGNAAGTNKNGGRGMGAVGGVPDGSGTATGFGVSGGNGTSTIGMLVAGIGTGAGASFTGGAPTSGAGGDALQLTGGAAGTSGAGGDGLQATGGAAVGTNQAGGHGFNVTGGLETGSGASYGALFSGSAGAGMAMRLSATGTGLRIGGSSGISVTGTTSPALALSNTSGDAATITSGGGNGDALQLTPNGSGVGINGTLATVNSIASGGIASTSFATGAITAASIAADAIGASEIAADAIGSSELAASAVTEISTGVGGTKAVNNAIVTIYDSTVSSVVSAAKTTAKLVEISLIPTSVVLEADYTAGDTLDVVVEDSFDGTNWETLATFTQVTTSDAYERITLTRSPNQYLRTSVTTTGSSIDYDVTVSLQGETK